MPFPGGGGAGPPQRLVSGSEIAGVAKSKIGRLPYVPGGIPAQGRVDCSSFVNMVIGWILGLAIPGFRPGAYRGQSHGPVVMSWATWLGGTRKVAAPGIGDLCIWPGIGMLAHIGICTGPGRMVSALNQSEGIKETPIEGAGPRGIPLMFRRLKSDTSSGAFPIGLGGAGAGAGCAASQNMSFAAWAATMAAGMIIAWCCTCLARWRAVRRMRRQLAAAALALVVADG